MLCRQNIYIERQRGHAIFIHFCKKEQMVVFSWWIEWPQSTTYSAESMCQQPRCHTESYKSFPIAIPAELTKLTGLTSFGVYYPCIRVTHAGFHMTWMLSSLKSTRKELSTYGNSLNFTCWDVSSWPKMNLPFLSSIHIDSGSIGAVPTRLLQLSMCIWHL